MTGNEWATSQNADRMLRELAGHPRLPDFACACGRRLFALEGQLTPEQRLRLNAPPNPEATPRIWPTP